jgi:putative DeoR family transcriptional regulator (stage III sporulation protein D)
MIVIDRINKRVLREANYIINTGETIREMARKYGVSKSTIHKDLNDRLLHLNKDLYKQVGGILQYHINIRHIRGGESTRKKYLKNN